MLPRPGRRTAPPGARSQRSLMRSCLALMGLLFLATLYRLTVPVAPPPPVPAALLPPTRPNTPFERSLRQAWKLRSRALLAEIGEREAWESWDPSAAGRNSEELRRWDLARDARGDLRRARRLAQAAAALARTPVEAHRAAMLLLLIERDLRPAGGAGLMRLPGSDPGRSAFGRPTLAGGQW